MSKFFKVLTVIAVLALVSMPAAAYEKGDWILRGGVGVVDPKSTSYSDEDIVIKVDSGTSAVFSATYMFSPNWGFDILAAWPFSHDINVQDAVDPGFSGSVKFGETKHLPPTFSVQYHFNPGGTFMPYAGLGLNYTTFMDEKITAVDNLALSLDDSFGVAAQLGADIKISDRWVVNADLRYIQIETDAKIRDVEVPAPSPALKIKIDPIVYSFSVGYIF
jgi:outer membrane protein